MKYDCSSFSEGVNMPNIDLSNINGVLMLVFAGVAALIKPPLQKFIGDVFADLAKKLNSKQTESVGSIQIADRRGHETAIKIVKRSSKFADAMQQISRAMSRHSKFLGMLFLIILVVFFGYIGLTLGRGIQSQAFSLPEPTPTSALSSTPTPIPTATPGPSPTTIPKGRPVMEINFAANGEGNCDAYDPARLGYENKRYYINAFYNGYLAICNNGTYLPQGSLQVTANPTTESPFFGYGVLFGWKGGGLKTSDACVFGIRRQTADAIAVTPHFSSEPVFIAEFSEYVDGKYMFKSVPVDLPLFDNNPHTVRLTLKPDGTAVGYFDEHFVAEYKFTSCGQGPIGMVAWGDGNTKVSFDDLKLFSLP